MTLVYRTADTLTDAERQAIMGYPEHIIPAGAMVGVNTSTGVVSTASHLNAAQPYIAMPHTAGTMALSGAGWRCPGGWAAASLTAVFIADTAGGDMVLRGWRGTPVGLDDLNTQTWPVVGTPGVTVHEVVVKASVAVTPGELYQWALQRDGVSDAADTNAGMLRLCALVVERVS
jgi:hypothetical protein